MSFKSFISNPLGAGVTGGVGVGVISGLLVPGSGLIVGLTTGSSIAATVGTKNFIKGIVGNHWLDNNGNIGGSVSPEGNLLDTNGKPLVDENGNAINQRSFSPVAAESFFSTKNIIIGLGVLTGLGILVLCFLPTKK